MARQTSNRQESVSQPNGKRTMCDERAKTFRSFAKAPDGKVAQSYIERNWAKFQPWAVAERPDRQYGPLLTDAARQVVQEESHHADDIH